MTNARRKVAIPRLIRNPYLFCPLMPRILSRAQDDNSIVTPDSIWGPGVFFLLRPWVLNRVQDDESFVTQDLFISRGCLCPRHSGLDSESRGLELFDFLYLQVQDDNNRNVRVTLHTNHTIGNFLFRSMRFSKNDASFSIVFHV